MGNPDSPGDISVMRDANSVRVVLVRRSCPVEKRYADVAGSTYKPEHTEFAVVARKR
jgi:hypothetical protein